MKKKHLLIIDKLNDKVSEWHDSDSKLELYEYLGMTEYEYSLFVRNEEEYINYLNIK